MVCVKVCKVRCLFISSCLGELGTVGSRRGLVRLCVLKLCSCACATLYAAIVHGWSALRALPRHAFATEMRTLMPPALPLSFRVLPPENLHGLMALSLVPPCAVLCRPYGHGAPAVRNPRRPRNPEAGNRARPHVDSSGGARAQRSARSRRSRHSTKLLTASVRCGQPAGVGGRRAGSPSQAAAAAAGDGG